MDKTELTLRFRYVSIDVTGFQISEPEWGDRVPSDINFGYKWYPSFDTTKNEVVIESAVVGYLGERETLVFELITKHVFGVENLGQFSREEGVIRPPREMLTTFLSLAYSACRGILFERLARSSMADVLMPVIDPGLIYEHARTGPTASEAEDADAALKPKGKKRTSRRGK